MQDIINMKKAFPFASYLCILFRYEIYKSETTMRLISSYFLRQTNCLKFTKWPARSFKPLKTSFRLFKRMMRKYLLEKFLHFLGRSFKRNISNK